MKYRLDYSTASGLTIGELMYRPILKGGGEFQVIDAGARNGMHELPPSYAAHARYFGFEPNEEEYRKLVTHTTDAALYGYHSPRWKNETFNNCALWSTSEKRPFYITVGAGACSLMGSVNEAITGRMYLHYPDGRKTKRYHEHAVATQRTTEVQCRPLDELIPADKPIDYLKLDVEGAELAVLEGARKLFEEKRVLFVKTEAAMIPYYEVHPLFGHQQVFLDRYGLRLLGFDFAHMRYTREPVSIPAAVDRRLVYSGDAYFALDPDRNSLPAEDLHRMGIIAICFGFGSFGLSLLRDAALIPEPEISMIEAALSRVPLRSRLRYFFERFPQYIGERLAINLARLHKLRGRTAG